MARRNSRRPLRVRPVTILFPYLAQWASANHSRFHHLMACAAQRGHRVVVLDMPPLPHMRELGFSPVDAPLQHKGLHVEQLPVPQWLYRRRMPLEKVCKKLLFGRLLAANLPRTVEAFGVDAILGYNVPHLSALRRFQGITAYDLADDTPAMAREEVPWPLGSLAERRVAASVALAVRTASVTFAVSARLKMMYPSATFLPNGAPLSWVDDSPIPPSICQGSRPVIGYVGAFEYFIDLPAILDAAGGLPEANFLLVGGGRLHRWMGREILRRGLRNCTLTGPVAYHRIQGLVRQMDVCLCPFRLSPVSHAASPLKFFEYLALSRVVIASRTDELLRVGSSACFFADGGIEIVGTVRRLLAGAEGWQSRVEAGRRLVRDRYNWDVISQQMLDALASAPHGLAAQAPDQPASPTQP